MSLSDAPSRTYHHGDLRRALLDATRELLDEGGMQAASLRAVARRAGVTNRAPYHHFPDKCSLLAAVASEGFERLAAKSAEVFETSEDPLIRIAGLGLSYIRFATANPGEFQVMFWHEVCDGKAFPERDQKSTGCFQLLLDTIDALAPEPLDDEVKLSIAVTAWSAVHGFATLRSQGAFEGDGPPEMPAIDEERLARELSTRIATMVASEVAKPS